MAVVDCDAVWLAVGVPLFDPERPVNAVATIASMNRNAIVMMAPFTNGVV